MSDYIYLSKSPELHTHTILGKEFVVFPDVFSPAYFPSTNFFVESIPFVKDETFLDMGTGSGVIAIFAALKGASEVVAADINPSAVSNTIENAKKNGVEDKVTAIESDVFSNIDKKDFDTIFWSMPFMPTTNTKHSMYAKAFSDYEYNSIDSFFGEVRNHLKKDGKVFVGFSKDLGDLNKFNEILSKYNFSSETIAEKEMSEGDTKSTFSLLQIT